MSWSRGVSGEDEGAAQLSAVPAGWFERIFSASSWLELSEPGCSTSV